MGLERRGRVKWSHDRSNWKQEDLDACDRQALQHRGFHLGGKTTPRQFLLTPRCFSKRKSPLRLESFSRERPAGYNETLTAIATPGCCRLNM